MASHGDLGDLIAGLESVSPTTQRIRSLPKSIFEFAPPFSWDMFKKRLASGYMIEDKYSGTLQRFGPLLAGNRLQAQLLLLLVNSLREGGPQRFLVLKNRKFGVSTLSELLGLEIALQVPQWTSAVIAHTDASSKKLFSITRLAVDHLPPQMSKAIRYNAEDRIEFGNPSKSDRSAGDYGHVAKFKSETAAGKYPLAGDTVRFLHLSECAKFDSVGDDSAQRAFILNAMGAIPKSGPSIVIAESTANGQRGWFYDTWRDSTKAQAEGRAHEWKTVFIPWYKDVSCALPVPDGYRWEQWDDDDMEHEKTLIAKYALTKNQLFFRRHVIQVDAGMNFDYFDQEYPDSPSTAFLASGRPVIGRKAIKSLEKGVTNDYTRYDVRMTDVYEGGMSIEVES